MHRATDVEFTFLSTVPVEVMSAYPGAEIIPGSQDEVALLLHRMPVGTPPVGVLSACLEPHPAPSRRF